MLTKVTVYSQWSGVDPLVLNIINRPETDLFEVRDINDGLGPVKANVNTTPLGSVKGASFSGTSVGERNIVLTLGLDPDWNEWTVSRLRRVLEKYFMPQQAVNLVFETMEFSPVGISGYVESNDPNMFSKDPEQQISIICPEPDFVSVDPVTITGTSDMGPVDIAYEGNVETGMNVSMYNASGTAPLQIGIQVMDPSDSGIEVNDTVSPVAAPRRFVVNTIPGNKFIRKVVPVGGAFTNLLDKATITRRWPMIGPGTNTFEVYSDDGVQNWTLTYYNRFGGL